MSETCEKRHRGTFVYETYGYTSSQLQFSVKRTELNSLWLLWSLYKSMVPAVGFYATEWGSFESCNDRCLASTYTAE